MTTIDGLKENGVVGAGGAGFPAYVKLSGTAEIFIVNAAECEPLLHKDKEILLRKADLFFMGLRDCMRLVRAKKCIIGLKAKYTSLVEQLKSCCEDNIELFPLNDFYPAGDEITLIYETTGRVVPAGELPITRNVIVSNVETVYNVALGSPVVTKFLTVGGDVQNPLTLEVPVGIPFWEVLAVARPLPRDYDVVIGGPMMGVLAESLDQPVTKTTGGLIVFSKDHPYIRRIKTAGSQKAVDRIGKSVCDQCTMCTERCPRYLLGHPIQPHSSMRTLLFSNEGSTASSMNAHNLFCCECNLCTLISCPEDLYPAQVCIAIKRALLGEKVPYQGIPLNEAHKLIAYRKTPIKKIMQKLHLNGFANRGPLVDHDWKPKRLQVMLRQHIGAPAVPVVAVNEVVLKRQKIASVGDNLGAEIHSPLSGRVASITMDSILIDVDQG